MPAHVKLDLQLDFVNPTLMSELEVNIKCNVLIASKTFVNLESVM